MILCFSDKKLNFAKKVSIFEEVSQQSFGATCGSNRQKYRK